MLPRSPFKGAATRYQRTQLLYLLAIRRLRVTERLPLAARIELALGLERHIRDDVSPRLLALAEQLREWCVRGATRSPT